LTSQNHREHQHQADKQANKQQIQTTKQPINHVESGHIGFVFSHLVSISFFGKLRIHFGFTCPPSLPLFEFRQGVD
jgi:hypothetical protein